MRKPTAKMIEALVELFGQNGGYVTSLPGITTSTWAGLVERELVTAGPHHALTDVGLLWMVENRHAVVDAAPDGHSPVAKLWAGAWICASLTPMTADQVTAELIRFRADRAQEAADLAKADAIRRRITPGQVVTYPKNPAAPDFVVTRIEGGSVFGETREGFAVEADLMRLTRVTGSLYSFGGPLVADCERFGRCLNAYHVGCVTDATPTPGLYRGVPNRERPAAPLGVDDAWDAAYLVVDQAAQVEPDTDEERAGVVTLFDALPETVAALETEALSFRDAGSTVVNVLTDGSTVADVVDDEEQTCGQPWVAELMACPRCGRDAHAHIPSAAGDEAPKPLPTGFLPPLNEALTPGECLSLDRVPASEPAEGQWISAGHGRKANALARLVGRGLAYARTDTVQHHHYLTEVGALVVRYRRALAAAKGTETPERVHAHILATISDQQHATDLARATGARVVTVEQVRAGVVVSSVSGDANGPVTVAVDPAARAADHGYFGSEVTDAPGDTFNISVRLTITRLRRGLPLSSGDRVALADLLDTVRRSEASYGHSTAFGAWFDISNTYRAHFGDPR